MSSLLCQAAFIGILSAQAPDAATPKFEVASIKPYKDATGQAIGSFSLAHGRLNASRTSLRHLIATGYEVFDFQISGGPSWMGTEWYDVEAKGENSASEKELRMMVRALLAERFKLAVHRETKEQPVYELVVGKGGPKIQKSAADAKSSMRAGRGSMTAAAMDIPTFARIVASMLDHPTIDKTGLEGRFDIKLDWSDDANATDWSGALITAIQELGLKLESRKGPVEMLIVDHAEHPTEN